MCSRRISTAIPCNWRRKLTTLRVGYTYVQRMCVSHVSSRVELENIYRIAFFYSLFDHKNSWHKCFLCDHLTLMDFTYSHLIGSLLFCTEVSLVECASQLCLNYDQWFCGVNKKRKVLSDETVLTRISFQLSINFTRIMFILWWRVLF